MNAKFRYSGQVLFYFVLSVADLYLTYRLVQQSGGRVYESNPIANAWLTAYGWIGLAMFKAVAIGLVSSVAVFVSYTRPRLGGAILNFACMAVAGVVLYSCSLLGYFGGPSVMEREDVWAATQQTQPPIDPSWYKQRQYLILLNRLSGDLYAGRCSMDEAVAELADSDQANDPTWLATLRSRYPDHSDQECLAAHLREVVSKLRPGDLPRFCRPGSRSPSTTLQASYHLPVPGQ